VAVRGWINSTLTPLSGTGTLSATIALPPAVTPAFAGTGTLSATALQALLSPGRLTTNAVTRAAVR
jgi:hypothetical protein